MTDDYSSDINTTGRLAVGSSTRAIIEARQDYDWFRTSLTAGTTYVFSLLGASKSTGAVFYGSLGGNYSVALGIVDASGERFGPFDMASADNSPVLGFTAPYTGDYFVTVHSGWNTGSYTLTAAVKDPDPLTGGIDTVGVVAVGGQAQAQFEVAGDNDWFKFDAIAGKFYYFDHVKTSADHVTPVGMAVYDAAGKFFSYASVFEPTVSGTYFLGVASEQAGPYTVAAHYRTDDFSSNQATTGVLANGASVNGKIEYAQDRDSFRFATEPNQLVTLELTGLDQQRVSLYVRDKNGIGVDYHSTYTPTGSLLFAFTPAAPGDYFADVYGSNSGTPTAQYSIKLNLYADDHGNDAAHASPVALGAVTAGTLQTASDADLMSIALQAGQTYRFDLLGSAPFSAARLTVERTGGSAVAEFDARSSWNFTYTPSTSETYYLRTWAYANEPTPIKYSVSVSAAVDDFGASATSAATLALNTPLAGNLEPGRGDRDWFGVTLQAGGSYAFLLEAAHEGAGTLPANYYETEFTLFDAAGVKVGGGINGTNYGMPGIAFVPAASGKYYLEVAGTAIGTYRVISNDNYRDDVANTQAGAAALPFAASANGAINMTGDIDVFKIDAVAGHTYLIKLDPVAVDPYNRARLMVEVRPQGSDYALPTESPMHGQRDTYKQFDATTTGTYYLTVSAEANVKYTLNIADAGVDDFGDRPETATPMPSSVVKVRGDHYMDADWMKVNLSAGTIYIFDLEGAEKGGGTLKLYDSGIGLNLQPPTGVWSSELSRGNWSHLSYKAEVTGEYYLGMHGVTNLFNPYTYTIRMRSIAPGDVTPPQLLSTSHPQGSVNVGVSDNITFTFNEEIDVRGTPLIRDANGMRVYFTSPASEIDALSYRRTVTVDPEQALKPGASYTITFDSGIVRDLSGNNYLQSEVFRFTTAPVTLPPPPPVEPTPPPPVVPPSPQPDTTAPVLASASHANGATGFGLNDNLVLKFSEALVASGALTLTHQSGVTIAMSAQVAADTLTIDPAALLQPGSTYTLSIAAGTLRDAAGNAFALPGGYTFTTPAAPAAGAAGNDALAGKANGMLLDGGAGMDTVAYAGVLAGYSVERTGGKTVVKTAGAAAGGDVLSNVERLVFSDGAIALDIDATGGQAYRLYQAAFDRAPDQAGVGFWIAMLDKGVTLNQVAAQFVASAEFKQLYGTALSDAAFVGKLYSNVLHRPQDQAGADFWTGVMARGVTREEVLSSFSESAENQAALIGVIGDGFTYLPLV